ncbi:MAG TPA: carbohydrate kinase family protein, partial [Allocoleopsis sp.]
LQALGPKKIIITDGKNGSYGIDENGETHWLAIDGGKAIERTGAGDAYTSGFIGATLAGLSFEKAMEWGAHNSTSVVSKIGAQEGLLSREQLDHFTFEPEENFPESKSQSSEDPDAPISFSPAPVE